jgi:DNA-binding transcriptional LysR family regulator
MALDIDFPFGQGGKRMTLVTDVPVVGRRKGNPLVANGMTPEAFLKGKHVVVTTRRGGVALDDYELARQGYRRNIALRCSTLLVGLQVAESTDYFLALGRNQLEAIAPDHDLDVFDFPFDVPTVDNVLFWHESVDSEPGNAWLRDLVTETIVRR